MTTGEFSALCIYIYIYIHNALHYIYMSRVGVCVMSELFLYNGEGEFACVLQCYNVLNYFRPTLRDCDCFKNKEALNFTPAN